MKIKKSLLACFILLNMFNLSFAQTDLQKIKSLIQSIPKINVPNPAEDIITPRHSIGFEGNGSNRRELFEQRNKLTQTLEKFVAFDPNADALFVGSLIQGKSLPDGVLSPITVVRNPLTITVTGLVNTNPAISFSKKVTNPTLSSITDSINQILAQNLTQEQPAKITYTETSMNSVEEGFLKLGASYSWMTGHVTGSFQQSNTNIKSRFLVRFVQSYYTVSSESPSNPAAFISSNTQFNDFKNYADSTNPPTYISSITYGRELWMLVESSYESSQMQATLDAAFNGGFGGATVNLNEQQRKMLSESNIQILALGGGGTPIIKLITGDKIAELKNYLAAGANYSKISPGTIISYSVRYLVDNSIAKVSGSTDYNINTSSNAPEKAIKSVNFAFHTGDDDKDDDNHVSIKFILLPQNIIIYQNDDIRPRQPDDDDPTWHNDSTIPAGGVLNTLVAQSNSNAKQIKVIVSKSGGAHWHFGYDFSITLDDGTVIPMGGEGNSDRYNFGDNYNSESWTYNIPW